MITLINQTIYLLDQQIKAIQKQMEEKGIEVETKDQKFKRSMSESKKSEVDFFEDMKQKGMIRLENGKIICVDDLSVGDISELKIDETWMSRREAEKLIRRVREK